MAIRLLFFVMALSCLYNLQAQGSGKIQTFRIYSGQRCVFVKDSSNYFTTCADTACYGINSNHTSQLTHIVELVMFDNYEFWYVENSDYIHHKDSLLFFTGVWKVDGTSFRLDFDSLSKPLRHFKNIAYRPKYFNKPIARNFCTYYAPNKVEPRTYYWTIYHDAHTYQNQREVKSNLCLVSIPLYLEFPIDAKRLSKFYQYELDSSCATMPFVEATLTYSQPIRIRQRRGSTEIKN